MSFFENIYSGTSFIISKRLFKDLNMFDITTDAATEWAFMNKAVLKNKIADVIPVSLYWERDVDPDLKLDYSKIVSYKDHQSALQNIYSYYGEGLRHFLTNWCIGRFYEEYSLKKEVSRINYNIEKTEQMNDKTISNTTIIGLKKQINILEAAINNYENATFWKMTLPLRRCCDFFRKIRR